MNCVRANDHDGVAHPAGAAAGAHFGGRKEAPLPSLQSGAQAGKSLGGYCESLNSKFLATRHWPVVVFQAANHREYGMRTKAQHPEPPAAMAERSQKGTIKDSPFRPCQLAQGPAATYIFLPCPIERVARAQNFSVAFKLAAFAQSDKGHRNGRSEQSNPKVLLPSLAALTQPATLAPSLSWDCLKGWKPQKRRFRSWLSGGLSMLAQ